MSSQFKGIIFSEIEKSEAIGFAGRASGGHRIATELRKQGWDIEMVDFFCYWSLEKLKIFLKGRIDNNTKFIGFSYIFPSWSNLAEELCIWIKIKYPWIKILSGSASFPHNVKTDVIDYHTQGYSEYSLIKLLEYLFSNGTKPDMIKFDNKNVILSNENYLASPWRNPIILYEDRDFLHPNEWLGIEFSRGCKFRCAYCNFPILGVKGDWTRDADNTELQLRDAYDKYGITQYVVTDETFNDRTEKITKFANVVESLNFTPSFLGFIRADLLHAREKDKEELLRMNFLFHLYGIESFKWEAVKAIGKGLHPDKIKQTLIDTRKYFETHGRELYRGEISLIIGLPTETEETFMQGIDWVINNWQKHAINYHILHIPLRLIKDVEQKYNISKMTVNFESYGYTEMSRHIVDLKFRLRGINRDLIRGTTGYDGIMWKNNEMDWFKAQEIFLKLHNTLPNYDFRLGIFNMCYLSETETIRDRLNFKGMEQSEKMRESLQSFANRYIEKKLGTI